MTLEEIKKEIIRDYFSQLGSRLKGTEAAKIRSAKARAGRAAKKAARLNGGDAVR
jgi:hypothetical protein